MAIFTDSRGRRYQNDTFREVRNGDVILDASHEYWGYLRDIKEGDCEVEWRHMSTPERIHSTSRYPYDRMKIHKIFQELVRKPMIIIC